jgi:hypothetical protein
VLPSTVRVITGRTIQVQGQHHTRCGRPRDRVDDPRRPVVLGHPEHPPSARDAVDVDRVVRPDRFRLGDVRTGRGRIGDGADLTGDREQLRLEVWGRPDGEVHVLGGLQLVSRLRPGQDRRRDLRRAEVALGHLAPRKSGQPLSDELLKRRWHVPPSVADTQQTPPPPHPVGPNQESQANQPESAMRERNQDRGANATKTEARNATKTEARSASRGVRGAKPRRPGAWGLGPHKTHRSRPGEARSASKGRPSARTGRHPRRGAPVLPVRAAQIPE